MEKSSMNFGNDPSPSAQPVQRGVESAGAALHSTIDKVAEPARGTVDRMSSAAHETVDKLASNAAQVADRFSEQTRRVTEAPAQALDYSKSWIQDKPLEAVGVALAVGFILGRLTAR
jgi:ElaB/YqjD/DUF883 family membrane-anchored ribosome-binding protein